MDGRFYFNMDENLCADEDWLIGYLHEQNPDLAEDEIEDELRSCREFEGWYECQVSNSISEKFSGKP